MNRIIIALAWLVSSIFIGAFLGFLFPFLAYKTSAQTGLYGVYVSAPIGLFLGGTGGAFFGAYRARRWRTDGAEKPGEINNKNRT
jgi:hypothetical protein